MKSRTINAAFGQKHQEYIQRAVRSTISVAEGAVRAGKTIDNIVAFASVINNGTPDRIHLATGSTAANAKLNIGDGNGYGLEHIFRGRCRWTKYKGNEALIVKSENGRRESVVIFAGGAKADSYKKIRGNSYGQWIATEINLHHEDTIREAFNRQLAARNRHVFWDLNPSAPGHWIYTDYIDRFLEQFGAAYNYEHFTIRDNITITPQRFREIEAQYTPGSIWYRRDILGERCIAEGLVYGDAFTDENIVDECPADGDWYISIDYGTMNPTAMGLWCVTDDEAVMVQEYYYDGRSERKQKTDEEYYADLEQFAGDRDIECVIVDPSAASFKATIRKHGRFAARDAKNEVLDGIRLTASLLQSGRLKFHRSCENTFKEFGLYSWDPDSAEDAVIKDNDHAMDQVRYMARTALKNKLWGGGHRLTLPL